MNNSKCLNRGPLISSAPLDTPKLEERICKQLNARLDQDLNYSETEIRRISEMSRSLFPDTFELTEGQTNNLRALTNLSQCELRPAREIKSHRKILGPFIVAAKRVSWKLVKIHFDDTFKGLQEFCAKMVQSHAKLMLETENLKNTHQDVNTENLPNEHAN